ncbi:MAG: glycerophosphodiester phosphodiesterase [Clostridiales Family XIII bacterium]|nr:glycerophosphodiester phosphodiesterase [Clostridiales Family XIII bacterium]
MSFKGISTQYKSSSECILAGPIAHRGLHDSSVPENSMAAFAAAVAEGFSIEIDVQLTRDKQVVIFHDDMLTRMTGVDKRLTRMDFDELRKLRLAGTEHAIPTLREFLDFVDGRVPILVEVKRNRGSRGIERIVCKMLREYDGQFAVQSFHPLAVRKVRKTYPDIFCGLLSSKFSDMKLMFLKKEGIRNARLFFIAKPDFISFEINSFPNRRVAKFREQLGLPVLAWTVRTMEEIERAGEYCDNIIFENIENLRAHLCSGNGAHDTVY